MARHSFYKVARFKFSLNLSSLGFLRSLRPCLSPPFLLALNQGPQTLSRAPINLFVLSSDLTLDLFMHLFSLVSRGLTRYVFF